jgi:glucokinase
MAASPEHVLLADIGATNARFALLTNGTLGPVESLAVADHPHFTDAVKAFISQYGDGASIGGAVLAVAGPVKGERCILTNCSWVIDGAELRSAFGFEACRMFNDFEATAFALPHLKPADVHPIGGGQSEPDAPMAAIGPGSGLGVACLVPAPQGAAVIAGEGGHATLAGTSSREDAIIDYLRGQFGHVSAERAISGMGLENLYRAIAAVDGLNVAERSAANITQGALDGTCATSRAALDLFCAMLGTIAGNVALNFGARGGVFIAGGIAPRIVRHLERSEFRARFEAKGRFKNYLEAIPTHVIVHPSATFLGLRALALQARKPAT